jgi:tRNA-specific adenosine deaminase 1
MDYRALKKMEQCIDVNKTAKSVESDMETVFADQVAALCYCKYMNLPKTGKPKAEREWTHVAGIVKVDNWHKDFKCSSNMPMDVVALGTGSKCIGKSKMSLKGDVLNDSHAEVMARRGFLRYLYHQVLVTYRTGSSEIFKCFSGGKCVIKDNITFHFFTSHVPCGDASIIPKVPLPENDVGLCLEHSGQSALSCLCVTAATERSHCSSGCNWKMAVQTMGGEECHIKRRANRYKRKCCTIECSDEDIGSKYIKAGFSPGRANVDSDQAGSVMDNVERPEAAVSDDIYRTGAKCLPCQALQDSQLPGADYHVVGALRAKPGRGEPTQSLSCSDKFAKWNVVGLQGALLSLLLSEPIYFQSLIVGGGSPFSKICLQRAIVDRLAYQTIRRKNLSEDKKMDLGSLLSEDLCLPSKYEVHYPLILQSTLPFKHAPLPGGRKQPCPASIVWCKAPDR